MVLSVLLIACDKFSLLLFVLLLLAGEFGECSMDEEEDEVDESDDDLPPAPPLVTCCLTTEV